MKPFFKFLIAAAYLLFLSACNQDKRPEMDLRYEPGSQNPVLIIKDNFQDGFNGIWKFQRVTDDHISIHEDPQDSGNKVMSGQLAPKDYNRGGNRSELVINSHDSLGYRSKYTFKFMLPESFFKNEAVKKSQEIFMILTLK